MEQRVEKIPDKVEISTFAVGIDISKGKSMVAAMRPLGELLCKPYEVMHTADELEKLANLTNAYARFSSDAQREASIDGQIRECTLFAERKEITVLSCYVDRELPAKTDNRHRRV